MTDADDRALVEAAQRDPSRFADLYDRHFTRVHAFVLGRVRDRDAAEDVTADVFHRALAGLRAYQWRGAPFGAWLIRIAANLLVDRGKRASRETTDLSQAAEPAADAVADEEIARAEAHAQLFRLVDDLPADQRLVIVERFVHERSIRDVAARLEKSEGAVKQLQVRALQTLRLRMEGADV